MSHDESRKRIQQGSIPAAIFSVVYLLCFSGLLMVSMIREAYAGQPLFDHDWALMLIGISILDGEAVLLG